MPKDEDILQLVSPALLSELKDPQGLGVRIQPLSLGLRPASMPLGGKEQSVEAAPAQHCPTGDNARPIPGLGLVVAHSERLCAGWGDAGLCRQDYCQGIWKEGAGPARLARSCGLP